MVNIRFSYCSMNQTEAQALPNKTSAQMRNVSFHSNPNTSTREVKISTYSHFPRTPLNISLNESKISALVNIFPLKTNLNEPNLDIACGKSVCVKINKHSWRQGSILIPSHHFKQVRECNKTLSAPINRKNHHKRLTSVARAHYAEGAISCLTTWLTCHGAGTLNHWVFTLKSGVSNDPDSIIHQTVRASARCRQKSATALDGQFERWWALCQLICTLASLADCEMLSHLDDKFFRRTVV